MIGIEHIHKSLDGQEILRDVNFRVDDPSLYTRLDSAAINLNEILSEFKEDPKKYLKHLDLIDIF